MPELPDIVVYLDCLRPRIQGRRLERVRLANPFLLRSVDPREAKPLQWLGEIGADAFERLDFGEERVEDIGAHD